VRKYASANTILSCAVLALGAFAGYTSAQGKQKRVRSPAVEKGSHPRRGPRLEKGQTMKVRVAGRRGETEPLFLVIDGSVITDSEPAGFGENSSDDKNWMGKLEHTGDYYIDIQGHFSATHTVCLQGSKLRSAAQF
jgi:hypothetical protein